MREWQLACWREDGLDIYGVADGRVRTLFKGLPVTAESAGKIAKAAGPLARRALILGGGNYVRVRKRYPPARLEKLVQAVETESAGLVPYQRPAFHCRVFAAYATHVELDIWAWEKDLADRLASVFPYRYIIPEDLAFVSAAPGLCAHIYRAGGLVRCAACKDGQFADAASCPGESVSSGDLARFLAGAADASGIDEIRIYGDIPAELPAACQPRIKRLPEKDYPPFLDEIARASGRQLRRFRAEGAPRLVFNRDLLLRSAIYAAAAYGLFLFIGLRNYDAALLEARTQAAAIDKKIAGLQTGAEQADRAALLELQEKLKGSASPLRAIEVLAAELPENAHATSLVFNEGTVEVTVAAPDPLSVMKRLGESRQVRRISLKGSPARDPKTGSYSCALTLEMRP